MRTIQAAARRHPRWVDGGLAALLAFWDVGLVENVRNARGPADIPDAPAVPLVAGIAGWTWFTAMHLALVWRRRAPVPVFWAVFALACTSNLVGTGGPFTLTVPLFAIYAVARYSPRRQLLPALAAIETVALVSLLRHELEWNTLVGVTAILAATVLLGVTISTRRAYLAEREERIRQLEHDRDQQARLAVAAERARIAREMHDIVAHNLAVIVALADGAALTATTAPERAADAMQKVSATGRQALGEMRRLLGLLRDGDAPRPEPAGAPEQAGAPGRAGRTPQPGLDDVDELVDQVRAAGVRVVLTREGAPGTWGPGAGLTVYRIVQEALTNTLKHAGPGASARVRLRYTGAGAELEVVDDGGRRPEAARPVRPAGGLGLTGMIERATSYGGRVEAGPDAGPGWRVRVHLTFDGDEAIA